MMRAIFIFLIAFSPALLARTVVLRSPQADPGEYFAYVRSSPDWQLPSDYLLNRIPSAGARAKLAQLFSDAQLSYTAGSISQALDNFKRVAELAETEHWADEDRLVFLHTYLRLAQLEHEPSDSEKWVKLAARQPVSEAVDSSLFPPPVLDQLRKERSAITPLTVNVGRFWPDFRFALIDGQRIDLKSEKRASVPPGLVHLTLLSDVYRTAAVQMRADQLSSYKPAKEPWVTGGCWNPQIHWPESGVQVKPFFSIPCSSTELSKAKPMFKAVQPSKLVLAREPQDNTRTLFSPPSAPMAESKARIPIYQKKWFWIVLGAAAVTAAIAIEAASPPRQVLHPTVSEGF